LSRSIVANRWASPRVVRVSGGGGAVMGKCNLSIFRNQGAI
jgi:hypothetical protein